MALHLCHNQREQNKHTRMYVRLLLRMVYLPPREKLLLQEEKISLRARQLLYARSEALRTRQPLPRARGISLRAQFSIQRPRSKTAALLKASLRSDRFSPRAEEKWFWQVGRRQLWASSWLGLADTISQEVVSGSIWLTARQLRQIRTSGINNSHTKRCWNTNDASFMSW